VSFHAGSYTLIAWNLKVFNGEKTERLVGTLFAYLNPFSRPCEGKNLVGKMLGSA
jgi:hypothetical protein